MRRKKSIQEVSTGELIQLVKDSEEMRERRNARRRMRQRLLKDAPREEMALRYRAEEKPCTVTLYLKVERFLLRWLEEFPDLKGHAMEILLVLAHNILHLLHPEKGCTGLTLTDCPAFSIHDLCFVALEVALNFNLDPAFKLTRLQIADAMMGLTQGVNQERLYFNTILGDISIDL